MPRLKLTLIKLADWFDDRILGHRFPRICAWIWDMQLEHLPQPVFDEMAREAQEEHRAGLTEDLDLDEGSE